MTDPWISQTGPRRVVVVGRLHPLGGDCTVMFIQDGDGWLLYPYGVAKVIAVRLTLADARVISHGLRAA